MWARPHNTRFDMLAAVVNAALQVVAAALVASDAAPDAWIAAQLWASTASVVVGLLGAALCERHRAVWLAVRVIMGKARLRRHEGGAALLRQETEKLRQWLLRHPPPNSNSSIGASRNGEPA